MGCKNGPLQGQIQEIKVELRIELRDAVCSGDEEFLPLVLLNSSSGGTGELTGVTSLESSRPPMSD